MSNLKNIFDIAVVCNTIGVVATWLPPIAALLSILWMLARMYEITTGKFFHESRVAKWLTRRM